MRFRSSLGFALIILIFAVFIAIYTAMRTGSKAAYAGLLDTLPVAQAPWTQHDMEVANTELMKKSVGELLNYDKTIFREYRNGDKVLQLYVAYWRPHKFDPRLIAIHVPDVCWVGNGWHMSNPDYDYPVMLQGNQKAWPAQYRFFTMEDNSQHVLYWHVVDGQLSGYAQGPSGSPIGSSFARLWDGISGKGSGEQFFIRLSSPQPWDEWKDEPLFKAIVGAFAPVLEARGGVRSTHGGQ